MLRVPLVKSFHSYYLPFLPSYQICPPILTFLKKHTVLDVCNLQDSKLGIENNKFKTRIYICRKACAICFSVSILSCSIYFSIFIYLTKVLIIPLFLRTEYKSIVLLYTTCSLSINSWNIWVDSIF